MLRPRFFPDRRATVFFSWFCAQYFHPGRSLRSRFYHGAFLALTRSNSTVSPASRARGTVRQSFSPSAGQPCFFVVLRAPFFPRVARPFLRKDSCTRDKPVYPAYKLAALCTLLFTRLLRGRFWAKKSAREKQNLPVKILIFLGVKKFFLAWRKLKICP